MTVEIFPYEEGDPGDDPLMRLRPKWFGQFAGIPTASNFGAIMAKSADRKGRSTYMRQVAAEMITGLPTESFKNAYMGRGHAQEDDARRRYSFATGNEVVRVGFVRNGRSGASPDGLVGDDGGLEIKTQRADLLIETMKADVFPGEHIHQCQGVNWVCERQWCDLVIHAPGMPLFRRRLPRDEEYIARLSREIDAFNAELDEMVKWIREYGR